MSLLLDLFKELNEEELYELCPNDKARHNLLRFIVSMHSPQSEFSEKLVRYCTVNDFVIGSGLTRKSVICLTKGKGEIRMGKEAKEVNVELIGALALMLPETAERLAEGGSVTIEFDGQTVVHSEGEKTASKTAKKTAKKSAKKGGEEEEEEEEEEESPKSSKKSTKKTATKKTATKKTAKKKAEPLEMETLEEFDEKASEENIDAVIQWATEQELEFEESSKPKITLKRIREAAINEWSEDYPDEWSEE